MLFRKKTPLQEARFVVVDCETTGLDPARDRLLSVGAVAVRGARIELAQSYAALVRQAASSARENVLVHGIGAQAQLAGRDPEEVLGELDGFIGDAVPVAFHAAFDAAVLKRAGLRARNWLDLEPLAGALFPARRLRTLDEWLGAFGIEHAGRHDALLDAFAAAELLLALLAEARRQGARSVEDLFAAAGGRRWLAPH